MYMGLTLQPTGEVQFTVAAEAAPFTQPPRSISVDYGTGLLPFQVRDLCWALGLPRRAAVGMARMGLSLWAAFKSTEAIRIELNPLALTPTEDLVAVDAKITLDDNALYRQPDLSELRAAGGWAAAEDEAGRQGLSYVALDGNVGSLANGAGLAMAVSDTVALVGGRSAGILDVGRGARAQRVAAAMDMLLREARLSSILVAVFGSASGCDEMASGILAAIESRGTPVPVFVRLGGAKEHEGRQMLAGAPVELVPDLLQGARSAVAAAQERA